MDPDNLLDRQSEPQPGKHGVLRVQALTLLLVLAPYALLRALHVPSGVVAALSVLAFIAALFGKYLTGPAEYVQIVSPTFEQKIQTRYCSESTQLLNLGFKPLFFYGEAFPVVRLLLVYPAFEFLIMVLNREVAAVEYGSKLVFGFPIFISASGTTYSHPNQLGMKYHTLFQDGTILMTKNFGGKKKYGPRVVVNRMKDTSVGDAWTEHQKQIQALEAAGKQIDRKIGFQAYSNISREA